MTAPILVLDHDDELYRALCRAAPELGTRMSACHQQAQASAELATGRVGVLVAGPSCLTQGGIRFLQRAHEERPEVVTLLVAPKNGTTVPMRDLVRIGASDLLRFPAADRTLRTALQRAADMASVLGGSRAAAAESRSHARVLTVTSPTGGCGKTFFATNLAYELAVRSGKRVAIVDLDLQFGEVITALRLRPQYTIHDLLQARDADGGALETQIREYMVRTTSGIEVLAAPRDPVEADRITSPDITQVLQVVKDLYHYVIVDTPAALTEPVLAAFDLSEALIVLATLDVPSIKNLGVFLSTLDRLKIPQEGVSLVLNKVERDVALSPAEVQRLFPQGFKGMLPYAKEVSRAINTGRTVLEVAPGAEVSRALAETIRRVLPDEPMLGVASDAPAAGARAANPLSKLFRRLLPVHD